MKTIRIQPAEVVDQILPNGTRLTSLPYALHVDEDGMVQRQDFWRGKPLRVIGFQKDWAIKRVDLIWPEAWKNPEKAIGMYVVVADADDTWATFMQIIDQMVVNET